VWSLSGFVETVQDSKLRASFVDIPAMANNYPYQQGQGQPHMPVSMPVLHNPFKPDRPALPFRAAGEKDIAKQQSSYQSLTNKSLPESQESRTVVSRRNYHLSIPNQETFPSESSPRSWQNKA
jgi:hypothetical protein